MITDAIISVLAAPVLLLLEVLPAFDFEVPETALQNFDSFFGCLFYIFPMSSILPIVTAKLSFYVARIGMAIIVRVKSFIPGMGA